MLVLELLDVSNWVYGVHFEQLEHSYVYRKLHASAHIFAEDIFAYEVKCPLLLVTELCLILYFKAFVAGNVSNNPLAFRKSKRKFSVSACRNYYNVTILFAQSLKVFRSCRKVNFVCNY